MSNFVKGKFNIKPTVINLTKTFDTFEDAYTTVIKAIPELKAYCGDTAIEAAVLKAMMNSIANNIPSISNENYPNTLSFSINSKEVGFKTDSNIALGWRTVFDRKSASIKYKFRITFISVPAFRKATIEEMIGKKLIQPSNLVSGTILKEDPSTNLRNKMRLKINNYLLRS